VANLSNIAIELFQENLVRGRGLLCRAIMKAQVASPTFTHVYAALMAIVNTKLPEIGELLLKRLITQFKKAYRRNDKVRVCSSIVADILLIFFFFFPYNKIIHVMYMWQEV
jgi:pre-mRNA-splicing factor CWC22